MSFLKMLAMNAEQQAQTELETKGEAHIDDDSRHYAESVLWAVWAWQEDSSNANKNAMIRAIQDAGYRLT